MLSIELAGRLLSESRHLHPIDLESAPLDGINDFPNMRVGVWLDHSESSLGVDFKFSPGGHVAIVNDLEESRVNCDLSSDVQVLLSETLTGTSLQKHPLVFHIKHL